jgi:hypothetical protein
MTDQTEVACLVGHYDVDSDPVSCHDLEPE